MFRAYRVVEGAKMVAVRVDTNWPPFLPESPAVNSELKLSDWIAQPPATAGGTDLPISAKDS